MKEKYEQPEIEVTLFDCADVIMMSDGLGENETEEDKVVEN